MILFATYITSTKTLIINPLFVSFIELNDTNNIICIFYSDKRYK